MATALRTDTRTDHTTCLSFVEATNAHTEVQADEVIARLRCIIMIVEMWLREPGYVSLLVYVLPPRVHVCRLVQQEGAVGDERNQEDCDVPCDSWRTLSAVGCSRPCTSPCTTLPIQLNGHCSRRE